nr:unnamed protein product [Spirometra erinaceieuropaei]
MSQIESASWSDNLSLALLGIRSSVKEDIQSTAAELVYGTPLRLPGEFVQSSTTNTNIQSTFVQQLKQRIAQLRPILTRLTTKRVFVHEDLKSSPFAFVRHDTVRKPLCSPYDGPYKVLQRMDKQAQSTAPGPSSVHNLSSKQLTEDQVKVLQHESSYNTGDAQPVDFIAALEAKLSKTDTTEDSKNAIRQRVASLIISHRPRRTIPPAEVKAIKELKRDEEIVIVPTDKGRATEVLDKSEYVTKAQQLLNDEQSYKVIDSYSMKALVGQINKSLNQMRNEKAISEKDWRQMKPQDVALARFYGLRKSTSQMFPYGPLWR